jgi:hypothetical protein
VNKLAVEVCKPKEHLDILVPFQFRPFANSLHAYRVHYHTLGSNNKAKELNRLSQEGTLTRLAEEIPLYKAV